MYQTATYQTTVQLGGGYIFGAGLTSSRHLIDQNLSASLAVVKQARDLIENPTHWIKGTERKTQTTGSFRRRKETFNSYCMIGAIHRVMREHEFELLCTRTGTRTASILYYEVELIIRYYFSTYIKMPIETFNDAPFTEHEHVLYAFDHVIKDMTEHLAKMKAKEEALTIAREAAKREEQRERELKYERVLTTRALNELAEKKDKVLV